MSHASRQEACTSFDYSSPEAQKALADVSQLVLEIREEETGPLARRVRLYESTLGFAVLPVLARRAVIILGRRLRQNRPRP